VDEGGGVDEESPCGPAVAHLRDGTPVGAWVLKARPSVWDIGTAIGAGVPLDWWRLAVSYRAALVRAGHPCVMWVTRGDGRIASGVWAVGRIRGEVYEDAGDPDDPLWRDEGARAQVRPRVPVELAVLHEPLSREELQQHPVLCSTEVIRAPRIQNPAVLTPQEWAAVQDMLGDSESILLRP
jgi:hypothetical protein